MSHMWSLDWQIYSLSDVGDTPSVYNLEFLNRVSIMFQGGNEMTLYSTTAIPALDLLGGVETLQRLLLPHTEITNIAWDSQTQSTIAVLKTSGSALCLNPIREALQRFQVPLNEAQTLAGALYQAKELAHGQEIVEINGYALEDSFVL